MQFVRFDAGLGINRPLSQLAQALRQDREWIREHTRLGELAQRWEARGRPDSLLLRADDLAGAQSWVSKRNRDAPDITGLMQAFIAASKEAEAEYVEKSRTTQRRAERARVVVALLVTVFISAMVAGIAAWWNQESLKEQIYALASVHALTVAQERALKPLDPFKECTDCPEMIVVAAGTFTMGSPAGQGIDHEHPQHDVTIAKPFAISKYELTFDEWDACVAHGDCVPHVSDSGWGRGRQPSINVSWDDAQSYVAWLSRITGKKYRLLSEAEYEYAVRAGTRTTYPWGNDFQVNGTPMANCNRCGSQWDNKQAAPVGSFAPNPFGLYDMVGNVWEWVDDCYHGNYEAAPTDGSAWMTSDCSYHVVRGSSWGNPTIGLRSATRSREPTAYRFGSLGFRVGRTLAP